MSVGKTRGAAIPARIIDLLDEVPTTMEIDRLGEQWEVTITHVMYDKSSRVFVVGRGTSLQGAFRDLIVELDERTEAVS